MFLPGWTYKPVTPPYPVPDPGTWDYGEGPPPAGRSPQDGPWLDTTTSVLYVPERVA